MTTRTITVDVDVDVDLDEFTDDEIFQEADYRGLMPEPIDQLDRYDLDEIIKLIDNQPDRYWELYQLRDKVRVMRYEPAK